MKASRCPTAFAARLLAVLTSAVFLTQCSMPPQQAWRSIQTQGLLPYLSSSRQSPPFRVGSSSAQRYAAYPQRRYTPAPSSYSNVGSSGYASNSYFSAPHSRSSSSRHTPRSRSGSASGESSPNVKIPVEEPTPTPQITNNPPPVSSPPNSNGSAATEGLPYGSAVPGRMNMVNSPFAGKTQLVDVSGMSAGQTVKCPYTGKLFKVPPTQQAANHVEPKLEPKLEAPKPADEPKAEDKKP